MKYLKRSGISLKTFEYYATESEAEIDKRFLRDQEILQKKAKEVLDAQVEIQAEARKKKEEAKPDLSDIKVDTPESIKAEMDKQKETEQSD